MRTRLVIVTALAFVAAAAFPHAQERRYLDKATFFQMESIASPAISPDGSTVLFSRGYVDLMRDQRQSNLWIIDIAGTRLRQLTDGPWDDSSPVWSPDGKRLAFLSNRSGSTQLHVMWVDTRETLQLTRLNVGILPGRTCVLPCSRPSSRPREPCRSLSGA